MATWRLAGFDTRGQDLELSELQLWSSTERLDTSAVVTCSHVPVAGTLADLSDGDLHTTCRWQASDVASPGFYIQWETSGAPTRIKVAAGGDSEAHLHACHLQVLQGGRWVKQRPYEGLQPQGVNAWYAEAPLARYVAHTEDVAVTASTVTCPIPEVFAGCVLFAVIMHRSVLTVPAGWSVAVAVPMALPDTDVSQYLTVLMRESTASDAGASVTFVQAQSVRFIAGIVSIDTGGAAVDLHSVVRVDQITQESGPNFPLVSPTLDLLESDVGLFGVASIYYAAGSVTPWTVLPPATGVLGVTPALLSAEQRRLAASFIEGQSGLLGSTQYPPSASSVNHTYSYFSLRIRPLEPLLVTQGRGAGVADARVKLAAKGGVPWLQGGMSAHVVQSTHCDTEHSGPGTIHGTVEQKLAGDATLPLKRRVRLHRSRDGLLVRETWSDAQGNYRFDGLSTRYEYDVIAWDHEGQFRSTIANNIKPEVLP